MRTPTPTSPAEGSPAPSKQVTGSSDRTPIPQETAEAFRVLMQHRDTGTPTVHDQSEPGLLGNKSHESGAETDSGAPPDAPALAVQQQVTAEALTHATQTIARPSAFAAANSTAVIDLIEKHVRRMLLSEGGIRRHRSATIVLRLADSTLLQTDLTLSRTTEGWRLQASTQSPDSFRAISAFTPGLVERFAEQSLGTIEVEPELRDLR